MCSAQGQALIPISGQHLLLLGVAMRKGSSTPATLSPL